MNKHKDIVQAQLEAYNNTNVEAFCACYHPDIVVTVLKDNMVVIQGIEELRSTYRQLFDAYPNQICHLESRMMNGDFVIDEEVITGRPTHPDGLKAIAIYGFKNNLIDRVWFL